jgi:hypothetical protein
MCPQERSGQSEEQDKKTRTELDSNVVGSETQQERMMLLKEKQSTHQKLRRIEPAGVEHDPAASSAVLREVAVRAHRLVREMDDSRTRPTSEHNEGVLFNLERELIELRSEINQLERRLQAQDLGGLAAYVMALRQRVDECLSCTRRERKPVRALVPALGD